MYILQWSLSITDTLAPDIFGHFLLQYIGFPLSEVKNVLVTPVGTKLFITILWGSFLLRPQFRGLVYRGSSVYKLFYDKKLSFVQLTCPYELSNTAISCSFSSFSFDFCMYSLASSSRAKASISLLVAMAALAASMR